MKSRKKALCSVGFSVIKMNRKGMVLNKYLFLERNKAFVSLLSFLLPPYISYQLLDIFSIFRVFIFSLISPF